MNTRLSILFWVRASAANKNGFAPLKIRLTLSQSDKCDFSSGYNVDVNLWNAPKKRVNGKSLEADRINKYILETEVKLLKIHESLIYDAKDISAEIVRNIFQGKGQLRYSLFEAIDEHNTKMKAQVEKEGSISEGTLNKFIQLKIKLTGFLKSKNRKDVALTEVNYGFISDFRTWLLQYGHHDIEKGGVSTDSATGHLKKLKKIVSEHFKRGNLKTDPFFGIQLKWEDPTAEGLTEGELRRFEEVTLSNFRLQKILDRFIVGCYTGMANSDITNCTRDNLITVFGSTEKWIKIERIKTGETATIPVFPPVQAIIDKYWNNPKCLKENKLFPQAGLNSCNEYLKEIAALAKVNRNVTTHTARHTFAQMAMDLGVNIEAIAKILGHASSKTTKATYAKASHRFISVEVKKLNSLFPNKKEKNENKSVG